MMSLRWPNGQNYVAPTSPIYVGPTVLLTLCQRSCAIWGHAYTLHVFHVIHNILINYMMSFTFFMVIVLAVRFLLT